MSRKGTKRLHAWMRLPAASSEVKMKRGCQQRSTLLSDSGRKGLEHMGVTEKGRLGENTAAEAAETREELSTTVRPG